MPLIVKDTSEVTLPSPDSINILSYFQTESDYSLIILLFLFIIVILRNPLFSLLKGLLKTSIIVGVLYLAYRLII